MSEHLVLPSKAAFSHQFPEFKIIKNKDVAHWSEEVLNEHHRQLLLDVINTSLDDLESGDVATAVKDITTVTMGISSKQISGNTMNALEDTTDLLAEVTAKQARAEAGGMSGISTGFDTLDTVTGGLQPGWLVIVGARLGQGKTWALLRFSWEAVKSGAKALFITLEQSKPQVTMRLHSYASNELWHEGYSSLDLMKGSKSIDLEEYRDFLESLPELVPGEFIVADSRRGRMSTQGVAALIEANSPSVVYIDYLTLLQMEGEGDYRSIGKLSADLKQLAETYRIPIVVAAQVNRMGVGKEPPKAENMAGSDAIGQDADLLVTLASQSRHVVKFRNAKFRHGPDGQLWSTEFRPTKGTFDEVSGDRAVEIEEEDYEQDA